MPNVEEAVFIKDLEPDKPTPTDLVSEGDDHIRLIKRVLKNTFASNESDEDPSGLALIRTALRMTGGEWWDDHANGYKGRAHLDWTKIGNTITVPNISGDAKLIMVDISFKGSVSGYGAYEALWMQLARVPAEEGDPIVPITPGFEVLSYRHVADSGNFEIGADVLQRTIFAPSEFVGEFDIMVREGTTETASGIWLSNVSVVATEIT